MNAYRVATYLRQANAAHVEAARHDEAACDARSTGEAEALRAVAGVWRQAARSALAMARQYAPVKEHA